MNRRACVGRTILLLLLFAALLPLRAESQLVSLKTVPVASGDQFMIFPSQNLGMGGVRIALRDPLLDPFINPAWGGQLERSPLFGAPNFYNITGDNGAARTLPAGALFSSGRWFGGGMVAFQQLDMPEQNRWFRGGPLIDPFPNPQPLRDRSVTNRYGFGMIGTQFSEQGISLAASVFGADLEGVDGVDLLYAMAQDIEQSGSMLDARIGAVKEWEGDRSLEMLLLFNRWDMTHDVTYVDVFWQEGMWEPEVSTRLEENGDRTNTWGMHLGYRQPLGENGWRLGGIATANRKTHPKIPNYEIMNIPRDPGDSWAYNLGVGLAREAGPANIGIDLVWEPIWSDTWADADTAMTSISGKAIPAGAKTVENEFRFDNATLRAGVGREEERWGFQIGLQMRSISYDLEQWDNILESRRKQEESWIEWTPTWGGALKFPEFDVRYQGRVTTGTGRPGVAWTGQRAVAMDLLAASDFIVAPSGPLTLQDASVITHQVSVTVPIR